MSSTSANKPSSRTFNVSDGQTLLVDNTPSTTMISDLDPRIKFVGHYPHHHSHHPENPGAHVVVAGGSHEIDTPNKDFFDIWKKHVGVPVSVKINKDTFNLVGSGSLVIHDTKN